MVLLSMMGVFRSLSLLVNPVLVSAEFASITEHADYNDKVNTVNSKGKVEVITEILSEGETLVNPLDRDSNPRDSNPTDQTIDQNHDISLSSRTIPSSLTQTHTGEQIQRTGEKRIETRQTRLQRLKNLYDPDDKQNSNSNQEGQPLALAHYKSGAEIKEFLLSLEGIPGWSVEFATDPEKQSTVEIGVAHFRPEGVQGGRAHFKPDILKGSRDEGDVGLAHFRPERVEGETPPRRIFFSFGLHARELVSSETGIGFVQSLLNDEKLNNPIGNFEYKIVLNANPQEREHVLSGQAGCQRANSNNVDLNRNWGIAGGDQSLYDKTYFNGKARAGGDGGSGERPFDQAETRILKKLIDEFDPDIFLDAHTGEYGVLFPYARNVGVWPREFGVKGIGRDVQHQQQQEHTGHRGATGDMSTKMMHIGEEINREFPQMRLPYGLFTEMSGLTVVGAALDYNAHRLESKNRPPYSVVFEMYGRNYFDSISIFYNKQIRKLNENQLDVEGKYKFYSQYSQDGSGSGFNPRGVNQWVEREQDPSSVTNSGAGIVEELCMHDLFSPVFEQDRKNVVDTWVPVFRNVIRTIGRMEGWIKSAAEKAREKAIAVGEIPVSESVKVVQAESAGTDRDKTLSSSSSSGNIDDHSHSVFASFITVSLFRFVQIVLLFLFIAICIMQILRSKGIQISDLFSRKGFLGGAAYRGGIGVGGGHGASRGSGGLSGGFGSRSSGFIQSQGSVWYGEHGASNNSARVRGNDNGSLNGNVSGNGNGNGGHGSLDGFNRNSSKDGLLGGGGGEQWAEEDLLLADGNMVSSPQKTGGEGDRGDSGFVGRRGPL